MNEKIEQLEKQTWAEIAKLGRPVKWLDYRDKFAELIVKDCADWIRENYDDSKAEQLAHYLEIHYGVHGDYV